MKTNYKLILFRDGRSILCSDEEIKVANWVIEYQKEDNIGEIFFIDTEYKIAKDIQKRIIAGIPELPSISMPDEIRQKLFELHGWVDDSWIKELTKDLKDGHTIKTSEMCLKAGFNKSKELRGFSLRDVEKAFEAGFDRGVAFKRFDENPEEIPVSILNEYDFIKSLQEPIEVKVELEMEEYGVCKPCNNQGVYHCAHPEECGSAKILQRPKTTNNSYTINKILTLL
jgi:hypothetical protein